MRLCVLSAKVTRKTLSSPNRKVKLIARFGVGYDSVDVPACTEKGVLLTITPDGVRRPVAASVIGFILALAHRMFLKDRLTREGRWAEKGNYLGSGLMGRTLGVIGVGNIGAENFQPGAALRHGAAGLRSRMFRSPPMGSLGVKMVDMDTLLRESDHISVNTLLDDKTKGLIGAREFALMKPTAYFINTARGPVVTESALIEALRTNRIAGAAIDVFEQEPVSPDNPLLKMDNVILAPHAICHTDECMSLLGKSAFRAAVDVAHGRKPHLIVNTEALKHPAWVGKFHA